MKKPILHLLALSLLTALSVIFFHSRYLINWDAGQFALGTVNYSLAEHTPHPPGYYLFVQSGKLLTLLTHDVNISFIIFSCLAGLGALLFFYRTALLLTGRTAFAILSSLFLFLNPVLWYARSIALTYSFEAFAQSLSLWATAEVITRKNARAFVFASASIALLSGFRPSVSFASLPLLAIQAWHLRDDWRSLVRAAVLGVLSVSAWFFPFALSVGGLSEALSMVITQAQGVRSAVLFDLTSHTLFGWSFLLAFNALLLVPFFAHRAFLSALSLPVFRAAALSTLITSLIFAFFHFGEVGYILALAPSVLLLLLPSLLSLTGTRAGKATLCIVAAFQVVLACSPLDWIENRKIRAANLWAIREHDARMDAYLSSLSTFDPHDVVVVVLRGQYFDPEKKIRLYPSEDIRPLSYYLPDYLLLDLLGTPGFYTTAYRFEKAEHRTTRIPFSSSARALLVLADFIHPDTYPKGAAFQELPSAPHEGNVYRAPLENINEFHFLGFDFLRAPKTIPPPP